MDAVTDATRKNTAVHEKDIRDGLAMTMAGLSRMETHAYGHHKGRWRTLAKRVQSCANRIERVLGDV